MILTAREFKARQEWVKKHLLYVAVPVVDAMQGGSAAPSVPVPGAPVLSIDSYPSEGVVSFSWTEPSGSPTRYNIYVDGVFYDYTEGLSSAVSGLTLGVPTEIYVTAVNAGGEGDPSNTVTATAFILQDTFTDANGTLLSDHTPEQGGPWTFLGVSEFDIQANKAKGKTFTLGFAYVIAPGAANVTMEADVSGGDDIGVIANVTDQGNLWMAWNDGGNEILYERTGGGFTARATVAGESSRPGLRTNGDTIYLLDNGVEAGSYTGSPRAHKSSTDIGIMQYSLSTGAFDNAEAY